MATQDDRYARQRILAELGESGQKRLAETAVLVVGCGALGGAQAQLLARAGVGRLRLVDRDFVESSNLPRQLLFDEADAAQRLPKAEAAARHLRAINSSCTVEARVADVTARNIGELLGGVDLAVDATDNLETRYLLNDACVSRGTPWVYGGVVGTSGMVMPVQPGTTACLRCLFPEPAPPGTLPTCDLTGVLNAAVTAIASLQVAEAFKLLLGTGEPLDGLMTVDVWRADYRKVPVRRNPECVCCGKRQFEFLKVEAGSYATSLCGRNAVQIAPPAPASLSLDELARRLASAGKVVSNGLLVQLTAGEHELVIFPDGRAIIRGTTDVAVARGLYARYVGI